jgi:hypothetical protein
VSVKREIARLLEERDYQRLLEMAKSKRNVAALLISFTYDKEKLLCWRAIEGIGLLAAEIAKTDPEEARNLAQRLLWMMREESGNNAWSAPEMLGEIVRNNPAEFADLAPIIVSFHDEDIFRRGVMRAILRIGEKRPDLVRPSASVAVRYLRDEDAVVRCYAVLIVGQLRLKEHEPVIRQLEGDKEEVAIYRNGDLKKVKIGEIAEEIAILFGTKDE